MIFWIWCATLVAVLAVYLRQVYSRFSTHGVKHLIPIPLLGDMGRVFLRTEHRVEGIHRAYDKFPEERFVGTYEFTAPMLIIRDVDLLKKISVKDFEHFVDHRSVGDLSDADELFGRHLLALKGQEWKDMRSTLSPAFTSSKIRLMIPFMEDAGEQMVKALRKKIHQASDAGHIDIDVKDLTSRYATDVIASCVFGLKVDSHSEEQNEFYEHGKAASNLSFKQALQFFLFAAFPTLMKKLKVSPFPKITKKFFSHLVSTTMHDREVHNIIRPDMIHLLMEAKKGKLTHEDKTIDADAGFATVEESTVGKKQINRVWSDIDLIAQAILFFLAGFETISTVMSFLLHELAINPDIQERLIQEIKENFAKNGGKLDYNSIQNMTYLDMVVSEVLRLWPPAMVTDRNCNKDYNLGKPNKNSTEDYIIRKGESVYIPVWVYHRDPEYFPNPLKFDPERFSEQNKHNIKAFTYMPFGLGPRNCIGSRFALCEVKVMVYQLLQQMELSPAAKTQIPGQLARNTFSVRLKGGHWVRFKVRS